MLVIYDKDGKPLRSSAQYSGEKIPGDLQNWNYYSSDPVAWVQSTYGILSDMCSTLYHTTELGRAAIDKQLEYILGPGLRFKSTIKEDFLNLTPEAARKWSAEYEDLLHLAKDNINYNEKIYEMALEAMVTGDSILYFGSDSPIELVVQGGHAIDSTARGITGEWLLGCRLDKLANPTAFIRRGENKPIEMLTEAGTEQAIIFKWPGRPNQVRGFSALMGVVSRIKNIDRWWDAVLHRAIIESIIIGSTQTASTDVENQARQMARIAKGAKDPEGAAKLGIPMTPGMYSLTKGEGMHFTDVKTPSNTFSAANEETRTMVAMGAGIPVEVLTGKYGTSYSASRSALNDFKRHFIRLRQSVIAVDRKINLKLLEYFVRNGYLKIKGSLSDRMIATAYTQGSWTGPDIGQINPLQEVRALRQAVEGGFISPSQAAEVYGNDFDDIIDQLVYEAKKLTALKEAEK